MHHTTLREIAADMAADMETYSKQSPEERNCQSAQAKKDDAASLHTKQHRLKVVSTNIVKIVAQANVMPAKEEGSEVPRRCRLGGEYRSNSCTDAVRLSVEDTFPQRAPLTRWLRALCCRARSPPELSSSRAGNSTTNPSKPRSRSNWECR